MALHLLGVQILTVPGQARSGKKFGGFGTENSEIEGLIVSGKVTRECGEPRVEIEATGARMTNSTPGRCCGVGWGRAGALILALVEL